MSYKCGIKCPYLKIHLINWRRKGIMCTKYNLPILEARIKCHEVSSVALKPKIKNIKQYPILARPRCDRGWGAITR